MIVGSESDFVSARWAAKKLGLHIKTIRRWIADGKVSAETAPNGRRWVLRSEIEQIAKNPHNWRYGVDSF